MSRFRRRNVVSPPEIGALVSAALADKSARGARDAAAIGLMWAIGMSPGQISDLDRDDFDPGQSKLRIFRNTSAGRWLRLPDEVADPLTDWISIRGSHPGPLLHPILRPDRIIVRRCSRVTLSDILANRAEQAGVAPFSPDDVAKDAIIADLRPLEGELLLPCPKRRPIVSDD